MSQRYEPTSNFLRSLAAGDVPLAGDAFADANLTQLIESMWDEDRSNRDWATFFLAQSDLDTQAVRDALLRAARDDDEYVRAEAISGLAQRDCELALPYVRDALDAETVAVPIFEAAALIAHPSLVDRLRNWARPSDDHHLDRVAVAALRACEAGKDCS